MQFKMHVNGRNPADAATYRAIVPLRNGRRLEIRALRPTDRDALIAAVDRTSNQSLYRRFFSFRRGFTESEVAFFLNVDFVNHVALVAVLEEHGRPAIVGGGRYIRLGSEEAEIAFAVIDQYQGQGIGAALMHHLAGIARRAGLKALVADVLPHNAPMLRVFEKSGLDITMRHDPGVLHLKLRLSRG